MNAVAILLCSLFVFPFAMAAQDKAAEHQIGSICVLPNSPEPPTRISPGGEYNPKTLTLRIDKQEPIRWPHEQSVLIDGLDLQTSHLVVLTSDGKQLQSFRFKFAEDDDARLCVYFDGYEGVQLGNKKNADWCRVKVRSCWR
jgi:hypothetical protein